jgi:streptogramin lyase
VAPAPSGPPSSTATTSFQLGPDHGGTVFAFGSAWVAGGNALLRVDPGTSAITATIEVSNDTKFLCAIDGFVWASSASSGTDRIDPPSNKVTGSVPAGSACGFGSLWTVAKDGTLDRIDPASGKVTGSVKVQGPVDWQPQIASGLGAVWVGSGDDHQVVRVDPTRMKVVATIGGISTDDSLLPVNVGFDAVWADANAAGGTLAPPGSGLLYRIDPATNKIVATIHVGDPDRAGRYGGTTVGIGEGSVWTADSSATITRVDPKANAVIAVRGIGYISPEFVAAGFGSVWVNDERFSAADWAR